MLILDAPTKSIEIDLAGAVATSQLQWTIHAVDSLDKDQSVADILSADGVTASTTNVTMMVGPPLGQTRQVKCLTVHNADTTGATITILLNNNGSLRTLWKGTILTLENLEYDD